MGRIRRIKTVEVIGTLQLLVHFDNGEQRIYDCRPLLLRPNFHLLETPAFFKAFRVDPGGYGILWNDDTDLREYELWDKWEGIDG